MLHVALLREKLPIFRTEEERQFCDQIKVTIAKPDKTLHIYLC